MGNDRPRRASHALNRWLRCRLGIRVRDVIGHSESLRSPFHRERVAALRTQSHADMARATMLRYRAALARARC
jgi:N-acetylmuramoyl-L-alanine amidase